jgi:hypothetical protein
MAGLTIGFTAGFALAAAGFADDLGADFGLGLRAGLADLALTTVLAFALGRFSVRIRLHILGHATVAPLDC